MATAHSNRLEDSVKDIIINQLEALQRPDLYRQPLVSFSAADDPRYMELKTIIGPWHQTPTELLPEAKSVISYFIPFTKTVANAPRNNQEASPLWGEAYQEINKHFNVINKAIADYLISIGFLAFTIPPTHTYDPADLKCKWSHRSAAVIAGLGDFGANRLVITDKGSGGRFCSLLTSAVLEPSKSSAENRCLYKQNGSCGLCFKACPTKALQPNDLAKFVCQDLLFDNEKKLQESTRLQSADICGKCISVCPFSYIE